MVDYTDVEGVVSGWVGLTSATLFQPSPHDLRHLTSQIHWGPPGARLGEVALLGDASESAFTGHSTSDIMLNSSIGSMVFGSDEINGSVGSHSLSGLSLDCLLNQLTISHTIIGTQAHRKPPINAYMRRDGKARKAARNTV